MDQKIIDFNKSQKKEKMPEIQSGDIVKVHKRIIEGEKERIQIFQGLVIAIKGKQSSSPMITVRRDSKGIGVEITVPIYSPSIEKIEVLRHSKVRRSKLYYMRNRFGKSAKMQVRELSEKEKKEANELTTKKATGETEKEAKTEETSNEDKKAPENSSENKTATEKKA
ncbi:MAG: 50S ribosomal protein L19 [Patescibacteria group bacterium]|jgi:large subunit ribosomal protein L19|nr:50S ribosomal protein L19 [Patescibacteria group bacterium]